jgi:hypothetical protein
MAPMRVISLNAMHATMLTCVVLSGKLLTHRQERLVTSFQISAVEVTVDRTRVTMQAHENSD